MVMFLIVINGTLVAGQEAKIKHDTVTVKNNTEQTEEATGAREKNSKSSATAGSKKKVKEVKSARPDMSKAKGARPPSVVRPSGSRIPLGAGKPKGAGKHGKG